MNEDKYKQIAREVMQVIANSETINKLLEDTAIHIDLRIWANESEDKESSEENVGRIIAERENDSKVDNRIHIYGNTN
jgi:formyltetrahydrofolate hydrolase